MSKPCKFDENNPLGSVVGEIVSARSALNMEPCPIQPDLDPDHEKDDVVYLSQCDAWAKHALEHLRQAVAHTRELHKYIEQLKWENYQLRERLVEARKAGFKY